MKIEEMISANRADCSGCEACANVCPRNAIVMRRDAEGFAYPKIRRELCIACGRCDSTCPALNLRRKIPDTFPKVFAAINRDEKIRRRSSSGGAFGALSEIILRGGGFVFGAGFDEKFRVVHTAARNSDELENLRGSKYVQSQIRDVYRQVAIALKSTSVLFSGTPCQCVGLKHFLGGEPENLLTVDIICHGTPSPALWENYIGEVGYAHEVRHVNFRSKKRGWTVPDMEINFADQGHYLKPLNKDFFGKPFLIDLILRPSCHACKFRFPNGRSDLTIGDAWGVQNFAPEMFDNRGTSVIFVHTRRGEEFLSRANLKLSPVRFFNAVTKNRALIIPFAADLRREYFFADLAANSDKFAVLQKYFYQDEATIRQTVNEHNQRVFAERYQNIAAQFRQKFSRSILVVSNLQNSKEQNILSGLFERNFPNCGVYFLRAENGRLVCMESFSSLSFAVEGNNLPNFAKRLRVTEIFIREQTQLPPEISQQLEACGLPIKSFNFTPRK